MIPVLGREIVESQIKDRQEGIQARRSPRPPRQNGRREPNTFTPPHTNTPVAQPDPLHCDWPAAGLHLAFWPMAVPNQAIAPVRQLHALHRSKECVRLCLDGLGQQSAGAVAQNGRQRIVNRIGLTEGDNGAIARHGVSLLREVQAGFHPPRYAAFLKPSSPRFGHSSLIGSDMLIHNKAAVRISRFLSAQYAGVRRPCASTRGRNR